MLAILSANLTVKAFLLDWIFSAVLRKRSTRFPPVRWLQQTQYQLLHAQNQTPNLRIEPLYLLGYRATMLLP